MTTVDWIALAVIALGALNGLRTGLVAGALSLAGIAGGAYAGARVAPQVLSGGDSPYTPLVALAGAVVGGVLLQSVAAIAGTSVRRGLFVVPPLRALDSLGGLVLGAAMGAAFVWVLGAVALNVPGQTELRREAQRSQVLRALNDAVPPDRIMDALARVDPFPRIAGPLGPVEPPDPALLGHPAVRAARASVFRITGSACGLGVEGSGWAAAPDLVVTNAHVVAGMEDAEVDRGDGNTLDATAVAFDPRNDVAVLRVDGLRARPLVLADPAPGTAVAILGYPENGPFAATAGRIGQTTAVLSEDAYGRGPVRRTITTIRGAIRQGNSGGPAVDSRGRVQATVFAARIGSASGYGIPGDIVRNAVAGAKGAVSTGPCVR